MRRIPSFEAYVELREDLPAGKSRHGSAAVHTAKDTAAPLQQQQMLQQQQREEQGGISADGEAMADAEAMAGSNWQDQQQQQQQGQQQGRQQGQQQEQQQQQQVASDGAGSMTSPASLTPGKDAHDLQPHLSVIVMPDGQHLALAIPEVNAADSADAAGAGNSTGQASAGTNAQQQQQQQGAQSRMRRAGRALMRAVVYLFVQPVPSASDFEQTYLADDQRGVNRTTLL
jgi:hypothetical protein